MPRFFVKEPPVGDRVTLTGEDAHHIAYALRMAVGDEVTLCDGAGTEYRCRLDGFSGDTVTAEILERGAGKTELPLFVTLYMALPKGDKLETVVQKAVELGACRIVPFESERCVRRLHPEKAEKQIARLQRIAREAAGQCGRSRIPEVTLPKTAAEVLQDGAELRLLCYEGEGTVSLRRVLEEAPQVSSASVVVGSEGGFSVAEAEAFARAGFLPVNLGKRILRCETAPDFVLSALVYRYEL